MSSRLRLAPHRGRFGVAISTMIGAVALLMLPVSTAGAATQIGQTVTPTLCGGNFIYLQSTSPGGQYAAPFAGVITSWSYQAPASSVPPLKFKVARPAGGNVFTVVGEEGPRSPDVGELETYPARIAVQAGDVIGLYLTASGNGACGRDAIDYHVLSQSGDVPPGTTATFTNPVDFFQLDVSATLEPDCDSDGFGDETQDPSLLGGNCPIRGRALTLDANKSKVKKGKRVTLSGRVSEIVKQGECQATQTVQLQRKKPSQTAFTTVEQVQTDVAGNFSTKEKVKKTFEYRAVLAETPTCGGSLSNTEKVKVKQPK